MTGTPIWRTSIVTLSFQYPYLLHALFSLSALHLVFFHSKDNSVLAKRFCNLATLHYAKCISLYRTELQTLTVQNAAACWACASVLALHAWTRPDGQGADLFFSTADTEVPWYKIHRGGVEVLQQAFQWAEEGALCDMIRPLMVLKLDFVPIPEASHLSQLRDDIVKLSTIAECWISMPISDQHTLSEALQTLRHIFTLMPQFSTQAEKPLEPRVSSWIATLSWTTLFPRKFCQMIDERLPQALVVVAIYCILLKRIDRKELWWIKGKAESLFGAIEKDLKGERWDVWLQWPREEIYRES
ncbi:hypothetical protein VTL71DRAFT_13024 [Oculimacula yallundae]|uniref:Uncharacterized protein n=1 Tax=Oculimacula yallundae TaxID=86028 RepID=A0ABR4CPN9_9HELO